MPKNSQDPQFATKNDLKSEIHLVRKDLKGLEERIDIKLDKIANTLDGFVEVVDNLRIENEVGANQIHELRKRVTKLESAPAA